MGDPQARAAAGMLDSNCMGRQWYWRSRLQLFRNRRWQKNAAIRVIIGLALFMAAALVFPDDSKRLVVARVVIAIIGAVIAGSVVPIDFANHVEGKCGLVLVEPGPRVPDVIKELRVWCGMSHREARKRVDSTPTTFRVGNNLRDAELIAARLQLAGAVVQLPE